MLSNSVEKTGVKREFAVVRETKFHVSEKLVISGPRRKEAKHVSYDGAQVGNESKSGLKEDLRHVPPREQVARRMQGRKHFR